MRLTELEKLMFEKGYLPVRVVAAKLKCSGTKITRAGNEGDLEQTFVGQQKFITMESVLKWQGKEIVELFNLNDWSDVIEFDDPAQEVPPKKTAARR